jgi:hypothetical protein
MDSSGRKPDRILTEWRAFILLWAMFALTALAIVITYARFPADEFYSITYAGIRGGLGRALVYSNYPVALIALSLLGVSVLALRQSSWWDESGRSRAVVLSAVVALVLCLVTALPGVVDDNDLDVKWINVVPFAGVLLVAGISMLAMRAGAWGKARPLDWRDWVGIAIVAVLAVISLPWIVADLGGYADNLPGIGQLYYASEIPDGETLKAVHLGHHHGLDGFFFATAAVVLNRITRNRFAGALATTVSVYLALMLTYGVANVANDAWLEQLVKRGTVDYEIPSFITPGLTPRWGLVLVATIVVWVLLFRSDHQADRRTNPGDVSPITRLAEKVSG